MGEPVGWREAVRLRDVLLTAFSLVACFRVGYDSIPINASYFCLLLFPVADIESAQSCRELGIRGPRLLHPRSASAERSC